MKSVQAHIAAIVNPVFTDSDFRPFITDGEEIDALLWLRDNNVMTDEDEARLYDILSDQGA